MLEIISRTVSLNLLTAAPVRTARTITVIHLIQDGTRVYCLDIGRWFTDLTDFETTVEPIAVALGDAVLPSAPLAVWNRYVQLSKLNPVLQHFFMRLLGRIVTVSFTQGDLNGLA